MDAIEYYSEEEKRLKQTVESEKKLALQLPTGVAFVTLDSRKSAAEILNDHKTMTCRLVKTMNNRIFKGGNTILNKSIKLIDSLSLQRAHDHALHKSLLQNQLAGKKVCLVNKKICVSTHQPDWDSNP